MDPPSDIRGAGLKFAERQMLRHGWTEGKGLGKREDGISEAIKVKVKCDTAGVGHNSAEQFTFHWWDHVFNKTASSISVEPDQDGVTVKKLSEDGGAVSSKKPRKAMLRSNMLYGRFIKSATLMSGGEKPMEEPSSSDSSDSSEDEDSKLDLSSATKLSDEDLMKICGGRTAHKGARHGLTMSAKLSRIEEQERAFMEKYGKKETKLEPFKSEVRSTEEGNFGDNIRSKKKKLKEGNVNGEEQNHPSDAEATKKKKKQNKYEKLSGDMPTGHEQHHVPSMEEDTRTSKKKSKVPDNIETEVLRNNKNDCSVEEENRPKKKRKTGETFKGHTEDCVQSTEDGDSRNEKDEDYENTEEAGKSKKKKRKTEDMFSGQWTENGDSRHEQEDKESEHTDEAGKSKKKKKKKKNKRTEDHEELVKADEHTTCSEEKPSRKSKNKKVEEEHDPCTEEEEDRSRRKKRTLVDNEDEPEEEEDAKATKKKKKPKRKDRKD